jgi:hypothetical protein
MTQRAVPLGRFTFLTLAVITVNPPQAVSCDWLPIA